MVPALVAIEYGIKGVISAPSAASGGSAAALAEAYRLVRDGYMDKVLVGGVDFNCD
jgi:3-oxoacyl-(acyl-carrier-protein) synthase